MSRARDLSRLSNPTNFTPDGTTGRVGLGSENPTAKLNVAGIVSATAFYGDGSNLEGVASAGLGTALGENNPLDVIYYTNNILNVNDNTTITVPTGSDTAYTQYAEVVVADSKDLIIADGDNFIPDVLGISTEGIASISGTGGRVRADFYTNHAGTGAPTFQTGVVVTGVATATSFSGALTGNATGLTGTPNIDCATGSFTGDVDIADKILHTGDTNTAIRFPAADTFTVETAGSEALRVDSSGRLLVGTTAAGSNGTADDLVVANNGSASDQAGITIRGGTSGRSQIFFSDGTSGDAEYRGMLRYDHSDESMQFRTAAAERLRITSAGRFGVNTTSPDYTVDINGELGITEGQPVTWHDGSGNAAAQIYGDSSSNLIFRTGVAGMGERMRLLPAGGLTFNGDTAQANALDDYEEGTWLPNIGGTATYDIKWGYYIKIGKSVQCWGGLRPNSMGTGNAKQIQNLPFTAINSPATTYTGGGAIVWFDNSATSCVNTPALAVQPNATYAIINLKTSATSILQDSHNFWQNNHRANFFITYQTN